MLELRWLKGNWEFGKFKQQYKHQGGHITTDWLDVPITEDKLKEKSLKDKFQHEICHWDMGGTDEESLSTNLVIIATEHFKDNHV